MRIRYIDDVLLLIIANFVKMLEDGGTPKARNKSNFCNLFNQGG